MTPYDAGCRRSVLTTSFFESGEEFTLNMIKAVALSKRQTHKQSLVLGLALSLDGTLIGAGYIPLLTAHHLTEWSGRNIYL